MCCKVVMIANRALSTVKDELNRMDVTQFLETEADALRRLKNLGTLKPSAAKVSLVTTSTVARLLTRLGVADEVIAEVKRLGRAQPPAVRQHPGGLFFEEQPPAGKH